MTFVEAMTIALREGGHSEEEIREHLRFADIMEPKARTITNTHCVKPGCERKLIDTLKALDQDPNKVLALREEIRRYLDRN